MTSDIVELIKKLDSTNHHAIPCVEEDFILIDKNDETFKKNEQAAHIMIYAKRKQKVFGVHDSPAIILMQFRFDGYFGFAGGIVDEGETAVEAVNREVTEEMNWSKLNATEDNHLFSHFNTKNKVVLHFYAKEVDVSTISEIESASLKAEDYGEENLGLVRIPLYTMSDGYRGLPCFLDQRFVGNAKNQLLKSIKELNILTEEQINNALKASPSS